MPNGTSDATSAAPTTLGHRQPGSSGELAPGEALQEAAVLQEFSTVLRKLLDTVERKAAAAGTTTSQQAQQVGCALRLMRAQAGRHAELGQVPVQQELAKAWQVV